MKKGFIIAVVLVVAVALTGCFESEPESIEIKNGFLDLSVEDFESNLNKKLGEDYFLAYLEQGYTDDEYSYHYCSLGDGIQLSVLAAPDSTMIYAVDLSLDMYKHSEAAENLGYYYSKVMYTVAPDITGDEIMNIAEELDIGSPFPGDTALTIRNGIIYAMEVSDNFVIRLTALVSN